MSNPEKESYKYLETSWVMPGIATPGERFKVDVAGEYLVGHDNYEILDRILDTKPDSRSVKILPDERILSGLSEDERIFVMTLAQTGDLNSAAAAASVLTDDTQAFYDHVAEKIDANLAAIYGPSRKIDE